MNKYYSIECDTSIGAITAYGMAMLMRYRDLTYRHEFIDGHLHTVARVPNAEYDHLRRSYAAYR